MPGSLHGLDHAALFDVVGSGDLHDHRLAGRLQKRIGPGAQACAIGDNDGVLGVHIKRHGKRDNGGRKLGESALGIQAVRIDQGSHGLGGGSGIRRIPG